MEVVTKGESYQVERGSLSSGEARALFTHLSSPAKRVGPAVPHLWSLILLYVSLPSPNASLHRVL